MMEIIIVTFIVLLKLSQVLINVLPSKNQALCELILYTCK